MDVDSSLSLIAKQEEESKLCRTVKMDTITAIENNTRKLFDKLQALKTESLKTETSVQTFKDNQSNTACRGLQSRNSEVQTKNSNEIIVKNYNYPCSCSIFNKLCRQCVCLRDRRYNDFVIHFNENTKYPTTPLGELIKNIRILKRFLYMNGNYTKNALKFLNEGLTESSVREKEQIIIACAYADICNIFDENSIVNNYIMWPHKFKDWGDSKTQKLTAKFLYQLAEFVDGKEYLTLNSKIERDLKNFLKRAEQGSLETDTLMYMNNTLILLSPVPRPMRNLVAYYFETDSKEKSKGKHSSVNMKQFTRALPQYAKFHFQRNSAGFIEIRIPSKNGKST